MELKKYFQLVSSPIFLILNSGITNAQILPDKTLPINSIVTSEGEIQRITGGSQSGNNLFHSFTDFSVLTGVTAYFDNPLKIENIISRVTGGSISNIDGIIRANGKANFFLINPRGIIFGPNARLNVGGSFLSSTADSIQFADGSQFSAANPSNPPLLTINVPIGLGFGSQPGTINVQGDGHRLIRSRTDFLPFMGIEHTSGLRVKPGKTLALVGGDLLLSGGILTSEDGRIELGSVKSGLVQFTYTPSSSLILNYENNPDFSNIQLLQKALVGVYGVNGGSIQVQGANIRINDGSIILTQNQGSQLSGKLNINASESLELRGTSQDGTIRSSLVSENIGDGKGGELTLSAKQVLVRDGARVITITYGTGMGGNLTVNAADSVRVGEVSPLNPRLYSDVVAETLGSGKGGDLSISTNWLLVEAGAGIGTATFADGMGGDLTVNAFTKVQATGFALRNPILTSNISSFSFAAGDAGNLELSTQELILRDGGSIGSRTFGLGKGGNVLVNTDLVELIGVVPKTFSPSVLDASTFGPGNAGSLTINTSKLVVQDGGRVDTSTLASGKAGNLTINASNSVEVSGTVANSLNPSLLDSAANILDESLQELYQLPPVPSGNSGDVTINTRLLSVTNGAQVSVRNDGSGDAGKLQINVSSIRLHSKAGITASTQNGKGGDISINSRDLLLLRYNSKISAEARGTGNGGNITINSGTLAALENSNISANAQGGTGGQVTINAQGLFQSADSAITATSEAGPQFNGIVQINTLDVDPNRAILKPTAQSEPPKVVSVCQRGSGVAASEFVIAGTGGIPPSPSNLLSSNRGWEVSSPSSVPANSASPAIEQPYSNSTELVEAQGWRQEPDGTITLTAEASGVLPYSSLATPICHQTSGKEASLHPQETQPNGTK